jgi:hypothetical protein
MEKIQIDPKYLKILGDSPTDDAKFFNFDAYIEAISKIILYPENTTPLSIVVNGRWGSGKTSLMKTLRKKLDSPISHQIGRKTRTVWFNAWKYSETDAMLASLVREIYDEIDRQNLFTKQGIFDRIKIWTITLYENGNPTQLITDLAKILTGGLAPDFTKWQKIPEYKKRLPFFDSFREYMRLILNFFVIREDANGSFDDTKGVLVIFIDDMDRCSPESIAKILESINLFFDQKGCIFVFGMDTDLIAKAVNSHYSKYEGFSGENYLKKIIQLQFDLPEIRKEEIKDYILSELTSEEPLRNYVDLILTGSDSNPRQIKQYINSLRFMMTLGNTINRLKINEELLIKWSILNLISGEFVNNIKINRQLFLRSQVYLTTARDNFEQWDNPEFYRNAKTEEVQKNYQDLEDYLRDERIKNVLKSGNEYFTSENLSDYIFLSSLAPKEANYLGAVTIVAIGSQSYYLGENIKLAGTSTVTANSLVYLSIATQDPKTQNRKLDQFSIETINTDANTFLKVDVKGDNTWEYEWDTSKISSVIDAGTYTIYACEGPFTRNNLKNKAYGTVSIILKKPFVSATASQSVVARGDSLYITGTATGHPKLGVQIWIFGEDIFLHKTVPVNPDASFSLQLKQSDTMEMSAGQYFVVVQHPMMNEEFDIYLDKTEQNILSNYPKKGTLLFSITGLQRKKGSEAAQAFIEAINDENIDDTYTKFQFHIEAPVITIDPIGDRHVGDKFIITATTNLSVGDQVQFDVYSSSFKPKQKNNGEFTGATGVLIVTRGDQGLNKLAFDLDTTVFKPDEYIAIASSFSPQVTANAIFNLIKN